MSPADFLKITLRNLLFLVASVFIAVCTAFGLYWMKQPTYVADATAYVTAISSEGATDSTYTGTLLAKQKVRSFIPVFTSRTTAERAINQLSINESPDAVAKRLEVTAPADSVAINIKASGKTPEQARDLADAIVSAGAEEIAGLEGGPTAGVRVVPLASAELPSRPSSPVLGRYLLLGLLAGLVIGYLIAFIRYRMDTRVRTISDVEETQGSVVLGTLPSDKKIGRRASESDSETEEKSSFISREALRKLRTNLRFVSIDNPPRAIVITSSQPQDGKSTVAVRLAQVIAASGSSVLLVDADLRRPTMATTLQLDGNLGLSGILTGDVFLDEAIQATADPHLYALPAGRIPPNPSELLGSQRMKDLLEVLKADYQYVIIDAPPLLQVTDAALLSASADGAIVVVRSGATRKSELSAAIRHLNSVEAPVLGTVLNQVNNKRMSKIINGGEYYGYGYGYASAKNSRYADVVPTTESKQPAVASAPFLSSEAAESSNISSVEPSEPLLQGAEADPTPAAALQPEAEASIHNSDYEALSVQGNTSPADELAKPPLNSTADLLSQPLSHAPKSLDRSFKTSQATDQPHVAQKTTIPDTSAQNNQGSSHDRDHAEEPQRLSESQQSGELLRRIFNRPRK